MELQLSRKGLFQTGETDTRKVCEYSSKIIKRIEISLILNAGLCQVSSISIMNLISFLDTRLESAWLMLSMEIRSNDTVKVLETIFG